MSASAAAVEIGRAERNKRDKRERLDPRRARAVSHQGLRATTTSEIAELADVAKGTLFFHAKSKEALLVMMFQEEVGDAIQRAFAEVPDAPFIDQLMHVFEVMLRAESARPRPRAHFRQGTRVRAGRASRHRRCDGGALQPHERSHRAARKNRGEIAREVDSALLAYNMFALYFAFLVLWLGSGAHRPKSDALAAPNAGTAACRIAEFAAMQCDRAVATRDS